MVERGDLVVNRLSARDGAYAVSAVVGLVSPAYWVLHPNVAGLDPRWLGYLLHSAPYRAEIQRLSKFMPPAQFDLSWDLFRRIPIPLPPSAEQRRIADFLDAETARIDALIAKKDRMGELLGEKLSAASAAYIAAAAAAAEAPPLRRVLVRIEQGWSPQCDARVPEDGEWGVLKVGCVNDGIFDALELKALPDDVEPRAEFLIRDGDLLVSRANTRDLVGSAAVVRGAHPRTLLCDKLYRLIVDESKALPDYISLGLAIPGARDHLELAATGASDSMQNISQDAIKSVRIPMPLREVQEHIVAEVAALREATSRTVSALSRQIELLRERRQALITHAVTGRIPVPA